MQQLLSRLSAFRLSWLVLCTLPSLIYFSGITERYGLRDDYSTLREAHEGGDVIFQVNASHGRPVYGWLLNYSFTSLEGIDSLHWARFVSALLIGLLALLTAWTLEVQLRWNKMPAFFVGGWIALLPAAQIYIHWAICWPIALAAVFGVIAFIFSQWGFAQSTRMNRALGAIGAFVLLLLALLDYQPNAMLFVVLVSAGWIMQLNESNGNKLRWLVWHVGLVSFALVTAFVVSKSMFALSSVERSPRFSVEINWWDKLVWCSSNALPNALALEVLADDSGRTEPWHALAAAATGLVIVAFGWYLRRRHGWLAAWSWWGGFLAFALLAYAVSFVAAERWATYRTLLALSGVVVVFLVHAISTLSGPRRRTNVLLSVLLACAAVLAYRESRRFIAEEQEAELTRLETAARKVDPMTMPRIAMVLPHPENPISPLHYLDEYGSLSTDADWCAKEMLLLLLHEHYPEESVAIAKLQVTSEIALPAPGTYDVLLDLRPGADSVEPGKRLGHRTDEIRN